MNSSRYGSTVSYPVYIEVKQLEDAISFSDAHCLNSNF